MPGSRFVNTLVAALSAAFLLSAGRFSQAQDTGTMFMKTNVGSFKILGIPSRQPEGKFQITFTGTLLINQADGAEPKITAGPGLRKEYENKKHLQVAYHGTGTMVIDGKFRSMQWFGKNMSARWDGFGIARLVGEFDKDLKTGSYWYADNPDDVRDWGTNLQEHPNPGRPGTDFTPVAKERPKGK